MFDASGPVALFDYFRVPYTTLEEAEPALLRVNDVRYRLHWIRSRRTGRTLYWPAWGNDESAPGFWALDGAPFFAKLIEELRGASVDASLGGRWSSIQTVVGTEGRTTAIWGDDGNVLLPFDPAEAMKSFWSESYRSRETAGIVGGLKSFAMRTYYGVRPVLPRSTQISMRRLFSRIQRRRAFPRWPIEPALHDLYALLFKYFAVVAGAPIPSIAPWPSGYAWVLVLTHDVETSTGYRNLNFLREIELRTGNRSSWNFVPKRYEVEDATVLELAEEGFEVGVHGLLHDGRDLESAEMVRRRSPEMRAYAERWCARGFRSPATHRQWDLMPRLGFDYDSSYPDTDPFEPQAGGCCTWLPYFNRELVELPITLTQDHTLFVILRQRSPKMWIEKANYLKSRGGMALLITHPDYMLDSTSLGAYERFLDAFSGAAGLWRALPRDVSDWWRRRAESTIVTDEDALRVVGPAAGEARIAMLGGTHDKSRLRQPS
jgi:hypothetical protein